MGQPASPLCGSVWREGLERGLCHCLASGGLPHTCSISSHFTPSLYASGALPAVALVLNPWVGEFVYILRPCRPFKHSFPKIWVPSATVTPTGFFQSQYTQIYLPGAGAGIACSQGVPLNFYLPHVNVGLPLPVLPPPLPLCATLCLLASLPLLPTWMNVASLNLWLSNFHTVQFSDSSGCYILRFSYNSFLWLCEEAKHVYLCLHFDRKKKLTFYWIWYHLNEAWSWGVPIPNE